MSAPQLSNANTSSEWFHAVAEPSATEGRSPSQAAIHATQGRRRRFVRPVTYTMVGLVAFTLLGVASFAWRRHSMEAALDASVPVAPAPNVLAAAPPALAAPPASEATAEPPPAPPATAAMPRPAAKKSPAPAASALAKSKPAIKSPPRPSPFFGAKKPIKSR